MTRQIGGADWLRWRHQRDRLAILTAVALSTCAVMFVLTLAAVYEADPIQVPVQLVNRLNYTWPLASCTQSTFALLLVGSHPDHSQLRDVLRRFWGRPNITGHPFRIVFLFGKLLNAEKQKSLEQESELHRDILQGDFHDSYHNVTLRDLMGLHWAARHCSAARFVIRADDDIAFDPYYLVRRLSNPKFAGRADLIACFQIMVNARTLRFGRYGVAPNDFPAPNYANYCQGWLYVLTPTTAGKLVALSGRVQPLWINDVFITGQLADALGTDRELLGMSYSDSYEDMVAQASKSSGTVGADLIRVGPTRAEAELTGVLQTQFKKAARVFL